MAQKTDRPSDDSTSKDFDLHATLELLTDAYCRNALKQLARERTPTKLDDLASRLSTKEEGSSDRTVLQLHHVTLPKLDDVGLITYDPDANVAELDVSAQRAKGYLYRMVRY